MGDGLWEDKEVLFDISLFKMKMRPGEKVLDRIDSIEDTKGNGGDIGRLIVTNLRIIWHSLAIPRINLSIGYNCIITTAVRTINSKLCGTAEALHILTKSNNTRFEFIFTNLVLGNARHLTSIMGVHKAYNSTRMYRELKLRAAIINNKVLKMLPLEQVVSTLPGVWNLSSDQGNLGTFIISNIRLVWFADMNENFNISLPFLQITNIRVRKSKFGPALVVESAEGSGGYVLGFRLDPADKLHAAYKQLSSLHRVYGQSPIFGVQYCVDHPAAADGPPAAGAADADEEELTELAGAQPSGACAAYLAAGGGGGPPQYSPELGLAVERLRDGFSLRALWEILPPAHS